MAENSKIEWTDRSDWNPIRGCTRASEGCRNCYAEAIAARFSGPGQPFHSFAERTPHGPRWTGKIALIEDRVTLPLRWRKPARIFVNSAFDLFHESIPDAWIDRVFAVMALAPQHTFQVLTKRSARMRAYMTSVRPPFDTAGAAPVARILDAMDRLRDRGSKNYRSWPLPNVWLGISAEDQPRADERTRDLVATPAAVRWVSIEPCLSAIDLGLVHGRSSGPDLEETPALNWVVVGGESGPGARPMHPDWARDLRDQCAVAGVPFFFKQWGEWGPALDSEGLVRSEGHGARGAVYEGGRWTTFDRGERHGDLFLLGKSRAGRMLDGRTWDEMPEARG